jgi:hypothetical protein
MLVGRLLLIRLVYIALCRSARIEHFCVLLVRRRQPCNRIIRVEQVLNLIFLFSADPEWLANRCRILGLPV